MSSDACKHACVHTETEIVSCAICRDVLTPSSAAVYLGCGGAQQHRFHLPCILSWFGALRARGVAATCPLCRAPAQDKDDFSASAWMQVRTRVQGGGAARRVVQLCEPGAESTAGDLSRTELEVLGAFELALAAARAVVRRVLARATLPPTLRSRALVGVMRPAVCDGGRDGGDGENREDRDDDLDDETEGVSASMLPVFDATESLFELRPDSVRAGVCATIHEFVACGRSNVAPWQRHAFPANAAADALTREMAAHRDALAIAMPVVVVGSGSASGRAPQVMFYALNLTHPRLRGLCPRSLAGAKALAEAVSEAIAVFELPSDTLCRRELVRLHVLLLKTALVVMRRTLASASDFDLSSLATSAPCLGDALGDAHGDAHDSVHGDTTLCMGADVDVDVDVGIGAALRMPSQDVKTVDTALVESAECAPRAGHKRPRENERGNGGNGGHVDDNTR